MRPQFVDFNADGHIDIVTATFDGYAHIAYGSKDGFGEAQHIEDRQGKGIRHNMYYGKGWKYEDKGDQHQITSAFAWDWEGDGDMDLLLGDYRGGRLYLRINEGTASEPAFTEWNRPVETNDGRAILMGGGLSTMQIVDWDGDGMDDLLVGEMGSYNSVGKIHFFKNAGKKTAKGHFNSFNPSTVLIEGSISKGESPSAPQRGLYFDATDYDGDGDLDLLVGGQAKSHPKAKKLTEEEQAKAKDLAEARSKASNERSALYRLIYAEAEAVAPQKTDPEGYAKARSEGFKKYSKELKALNEAYSTASRAYLKLVPSPKTKNQVWVYHQKSDASNELKTK